MEIPLASMGESSTPDDGLIEWPDAHPGDGSLNHSAYNQSRRESLCADVELVDLPPDNLRDHFAALTPGSEKALWLVPFQGISADHVSFPIDLVFLDRNNCVLALTESFPTRHATKCNWPVGSVLALPAETIAAREVLPGDKLILCSPEKLHHILQNVQVPEDYVPDLDIPSCGFDYNTPEVPEETPDSDAAIPSDEIASENLPEAQMQSESAQTQLKLAPTQPAQFATEPPKSSQPGRPKNWILRRLRPHSKELRRSPRESQPLIAAYFFNEGTPVPSAVRDISLDGMYVSTEERWELGTIVRATLAGWRQPSPVQPLIVNATVARCDGDGIAFRFIFDKDKNLQLGSMPSNSDWYPANVTRKQVKSFLRQFRRHK